MHVAAVAGEALTWFGHEDGRYTELGADGFDHISDLRLACNPYFIFFFFSRSFLCQIKYVLE